MQDATVYRLLGAARCSVTRPGFASFGYQTAQQKRRGAVEVGPDSLGDAGLADCANSLERLSDRLFGAQEDQQAKRGKTQKKKKKKANKPSLLFTGHSVSALAALGHEEGPTTPALAQILEVLPEASHAEALAALESSGGNVEGAVALLLG